MAETERIPPEILRKVRRIELSTRHLVDDLFGGEYHSVFKGMGMEFDEVREYSPGDEVRSIDWNVTARMGKPFVKRYREERELTVVLAVDASASGLFGSQDRLKSEIIAEVASVLAFSAIRNQDKVGCLIFTDKVEKFIPPEKGHRHVLRIIRELLYFKPQGSGTDLGKALEMLSHLLKRKAVVFLISDFMDEGYDTPLRLAARRHDLIALNIADPLENRLPSVGLLHLRDAETGERFWVDTGNRWVRKHFAEEAAERQRRLAQTFGRYGVDEISLDVTQDTVGPLVRFFRQRLKRISRGVGRRGKALAPLLLALTLAGSAGAWAQTTSPPPGPRPASPGQPSGQPIPGQVPQPSGPMPGMAGPHGGSNPQGGLPLLPREKLEELELPELADLTADSRPRLERSVAPGIEVESLLARDLQTIGERNELSWRVVLPEGGRLLSVQWDLGEPGQIQPLPDFAALGEGESTLRQEAGDLAPPDSSGLSPAFLLTDTLRGSGPDTLRFRLPFTCFRPDTFAIPGQRLSYLPAAAAEPAELLTPALELACMSVLAVHPDTASLRDWKSPGSLRVDWMPLLLKVGLPLLILLALAVWALLFWWRRRRRQGEPLIPAVPPDEEALVALETLALADLPGKGAFHEYYFRLSQIVRRYLSRRYHLPFSDWTTEEIQAALSGPKPRIVLNGELTAALLADLDRADLVKFAHRTPSRADCQVSLDAGQRLVRSTRPRLEATTGDLPGAEPEGALP